METIGSNSLVSNIAYQPFGGPKAWTFPNGETATRSYDLDGRIASDPVETIGYDAASRVSGLTLSNFSYAGGSQTFGYDALDRITSYTGPNGPISYSYDASGNRTSQTINGNTVTYTISPSSNRIVSSSLDSYSYDANGSLISYNNSNLGYDSRGREANWSSGSATAFYRYNELGQRTYRAPNGVLASAYNYDESGHLIGEYHGHTQAIQETVYLGDMPIAVLFSGTTAYYLHTDYRNAPRQIDNASGQATWSWTPTPFGENLPNSNPSNLPSSVTYNLRFPGQYYDGTSGLFYNLGRYYDSALGRYTSSDPIGLAGGINTYAYTRGNPISFTDPSGLVPNPAEATCVDPVQPVCWGGVLVDLASTVVTVGIAAKVVDQSTPADPNNCPNDKCKGIEAEIARIAADLTLRHFGLVVDPLDLYGQAYDQANLGKRAGTYTGHQGLFEGRKVQLRRLIAQADANGCKVDPAVRALLGLDSVSAPLQPWGN
jgi:RHS repeat-associated protein